MSTMIEKTRLNGGIVYFVLIFLLPSPAGADDHSQYGQERLQQLQKNHTEPSFERIGTFTEKDGYTSNNIILMVKIVSICQEQIPCKPMIWRHRENGNIVQYEIHNCSPDRVRRVATARAKQAERYEKWLKKEKERRENRARENEEWQGDRRERMRQASLQWQIDRIGRYRTYSRRRYCYGY